ncbi:hypothetical protein Y036_4414 [Burkholderia pseudomallei]|uniref:Uncharacterized protein n=1 Tax=Burkholderia pseudomallei TaxID=28450 RepID=A0AA40MGB1_BURPE|nr:hypothetical protein Y036_4414 [Burkholderia pseudomallei]
MPIDAPRPGTARVRSDAARRTPRLRPPNRRSACPHFLWSSLWTSRASAAQPIDPATFFPATLAKRQRDRRARIVERLRARAHSGADAGAAVGSRRRDWLVHTFCGQACGHLAHSIRKPLIRRYKHRRINQAARGNAGDETALQAPTAARRGARFSRSSRVAASAHRRFSACFQPRRSRRLFHNFCWQACGQAEHWAFNPLIRRPFPERVKQAATHANRAVGRRMISRCHALSPACRATSTSAHPVSRIRHPVSGIRRRYIGHRARMAFSTTFVGKLVDILSIRRPTR